MKRRIFRKISIFICLVLLFCSFSFRVVNASSISDQSKPIFGLTADDVVEKYNQLSEFQKDQVLCSLGNTSIFSNSLFGNVFNSSFGVLNDAVKKIGDLFFQANGVIYKLGSSALAWVSRLIDKVFDNSLNDINISQPVVDDFYLNTKDLTFDVDPIFIQYHVPEFLDTKENFNFTLPFPSNSFVYTCNNSTIYKFSLLEACPVFYNTWHFGLFLDLDNSRILFTRFKYDFENEFGFHISSFELPSYYSNEDRTSLSSSWYGKYCGLTDSNILWTNGYFSYVPPVVNFSSSNKSLVFSNYLNNYFSYIPYYYVISNGYASKLFLDQDSQVFNITNNSYFNYIYNIPDQTPLNVTNIVSNSAINYDPVENIIQYLPDNYNIEQNFSVVNNYFISSGSAISGQAIDVNLVSPSVIDVRVINPEDLTQQVTNNVSKDIINNTDVNFGDLDFSSSVTIGINAAKDSIDGIVASTSSAIIASFLGTVPTDWTLLVIVFLALFILAGFGMSIIRH